MKKVTFTYGRLVALVVLLGLCLLLFLQIQMRLVERQLGGLALGYFADNTRDTLQTMRENIARLVRDGRMLPDAALADEMQFMAESTHAGYVLVVLGNARAELVDARTGVRATMEETGDEKVSYSLSRVAGAGGAAPEVGSIAGDELRDFALALRANLLFVVPPAESAPVMSLMTTPEGKRFVLLYMQAPATQKPITVCLVFTPEFFLNRLAAAIPVQMSAALLQQDKVLAVSSAAERQYRELTGDGSVQVPFAAFLDRLGPAGEEDLVEIITEDSVTGLRIVFISQGMGLLRGLLAKPEFLITLGVFVLVLVVLVLAISRYLTRHRRYYRPEVVVDADFVRTLIKQGEGMHVEFKSTLRQNLQSGKRDKSMEIAVLKGMCAFMNTLGGTMIVGVGDGGEILGVEPDGFRSEDHALRHLGNVFNECVGARHFNCVSLHTCKLDDKLVLVVLCRQSTTPVFLRHQSVESFYVRQGPSNRSLSLGEFWEVSHKFKR
ncbi:ATP-binding protein [Desulfovibrio mangrovi]|uniref:AlbA family DNA-binding domain-containing protein n=1 Tax=Desulfovibrio mangrovi TaxID=2976983 RepID=UPI002247971D|nr:ATP-binding protein [Desulfovibrio mangrovi]UZP68874.1 ATP-binding protein [Desulfovibrio mangrovi]